jgi:hypothetical protein
LPQLVPLDYIEEIYIPKNLFASLTPAAQESAKKIFRDSLHITEHEINLTATGGGGSHPADKSRQDYQDYVTNKLIEKFEKQMERTRPLYGTVITLAPSQFTDHIVLPLTITDAHDQYQKTRKHASNSDETYIYWQAMYGDMMITLSNEQIDPGTSQPDILCLVCYIAERPSTTTTNYNESYSYLNAGDPYRHGMIMNDGRCSRNSRTFHRGCNIDDFLTYCLKLENKTGQVTLSHAGSNGIYCYETISYKFTQKTLDLNKLKYIHVSAGSQKVPIRNLTVSFEQIADLHPTFDKNFKRGDNASSQNRKPEVRDRQLPPPDAEEPSNEKPPSVVDGFVKRIGGFFGYDPDGKKLEPCPYSVNCLLRSSPKHMKEYSHDEQIPITKGKTRKHSSFKTSLSFKSIFLNLLFIFVAGAPHASPLPERVPGGYQEQVSHDGRRNDRRTPCRHGEKCRDRDNRQHCSEYSHPQERESNPSASSSHGRTPCRHGEKCWSQDDSQHCLEYSHPHERDSKPSDSSSHERTPCRYGSDCRDQNKMDHCSQYSHPQERGSKASASSSHGRTSCRHGEKCRNQDDPQHCSKYSHPDE